MATSPIQQVTNNVGSNYCKMPDGTLIQWGYGTIAKNADNVTVTFPVSFVDTLYGFNAIPVFESDRTMTLVYARVNANNIGVFSKTNPITSNNGQAFKWIATGRWK